MRSLEFALLVVFQVVIISLGYMFISQMLTPGSQETMTVQHDGTAYEVPVLRDENGNIRPATSQEEVESLILRNLPGDAPSLSEWMERQVSVRP